MANQKIDLEQLKRHYLEWLTANKHRFYRQRVSFVNSLDWVEPESVLNPESILPFWQVPGSSTPSAYRLLGELFKAGILVNASNDGALAYAGKESCFSGGDNSDLS